MKEDAGRMNHYRVLQVTREADPEVIDRAYKALARKYHPDSPGGDNRRMQRLNEAYRVLREPRSRNLYDKELGAARESSAWEQFLERGLVGLFIDTLRTNERR